MKVNLFKFMKKLGEAKINKDLPETVEVETKDILKLMSMSHQNKMSYDYRERVICELKDVLMVYAGRRYDRFTFEVETPSIFEQVFKGKKSKVYMIDKVYSMREDARALATRILNDYNL